MLLFSSMKDIDHHQKEKKASREKEKEKQNEEHAEAIRTMGESLDSQNINEMADLVTLDFENKMKGLKHKHCPCCQRVGLFVNLVKPRDSDTEVCTKCASTKAWQNNTVEGLPFWIDSEGEKQYDIPEELTCLREGEKLLIQQVSCYVPVLHLKHGQLGSQGHVCSFPLDLSEVCDKLPRFPNDVKVLKVVKTFQLDGGEIGTKAFHIRKDIVLNALRWLKKFNILYRDIEIIETNLDWIENGDEQELPCEIHQTNGNTTEEKDLGPSPIQVEHNNDLNDPVDHCFGVIPVVNNSKPKAKDKEVTECLEKAATQANMDFPYVSTDPVDEFDESQKIFCLAFPWLFPGGVGDFNDYRETSISLDDWIDNLLYYYDGRFASDKIWGFYVLNYQARRKNQTSGGFFVDGFYKDGPQNLEDLQEAISNGDNSWIDRITYYSQRVKGSAGYWRAKKAELYSWINYHVEQKNGAPNFFITLSCAEYHWPDIARLIADRFECVGLESPDLDNAYTKIINEYTLIVQEYFQARVETWLETVGKKVFGIKHYWVRYEFAPSRGQIHAHMLVITDHQGVFNKVFEMKNDKESQAAFLQQWVEKSFNMTTGVGFDLPNEIEKKDMNLESHPSKAYYGEQEDKKEDARQCLLCMQQHVCSAYCMRKRKYL